MIIARALSRLALLAVVSTLTACAAAGTPSARQSGSASLSGSVRTTPAASPSAVRYTSQQVKALTPTLQDLPAGWTQERGVDVKAAGDYGLEYTEYRADGACADGLNRFVHPEREYYRPLLTGAWRSTYRHAASNAVAVAEVDAFSTASMDFQMDTLISAMLNCDQVQLDFGDGDVATMKVRPLRYPTQGRKTLSVVMSGTTTRGAPVSKAVIITSVDYLDLKASAYASSADWAARLATRIADHLVAKAAARSPHS